MDPSLSFWNERNLVSLTLNDVKCMCVGNGSQVTHQFK